MSSNSNSFYNGTSGSNNITFTTPTSGDVTSTINLNNSNNVWFPHYMQSTWLPYNYTSYKPEFHIKLGYKNQMKKMWD